MSERPLIEAAMKRLAEERAEAAASMSAGAEVEADNRGTVGRRSYDEALAWRRAQLAAAMGTAPTPAAAPVERRVAPPKPETSLGRRVHEVDALGHAIVPAPVVHRGFTLAELVGTGVVCAVASAAITGAVVLSQGPVPGATVSAALPPASKALLVDRAAVIPAPLAAPAAPAAPAEAAAPVAPPRGTPSTPSEAPIPAPVEVAPVPVVAVHAAASIPAPAPAPAAMSGFDEAAARATVEAWRAAWSAIDADRYLATYAPDFVSEDGLSGAAWAESRRANFARKSQIDVRVDKLKLTPVDADHFEAEFVQDYAAGKYRERGTRKTLVLRRTPDGWRISAERQSR